MNTSKTEPPADMRAAASGLWQMFVALTDQGFTEQQALQVVGHVLVSSQIGGKDR